MRYIVYSGLIVAGLLFAKDTLEVDANQASDYFRAEEFTQALKLYSQLKKKDLQPLQEATVEYNQATTLLALQRYADAIALFDSILAKGQQDPLLQYRLYTNLSLAYLLWATLEPIDELSLESLQTCMTRLKSSIDNIEKSLGAYKDYVTLEGREFIDNPNSYAAIRDQAKAYLDRCKKRQKQLNLEKLTATEVIAQLHTGLEQSLKHADAVGFKIENTSHRQYFTKMHFIREKAKESLWDIASKLYEIDLENAEKESEEKQQAATSRLAILSDSRNDFLSALDYMREGNMLTSRKHLSKSYLKTRLLYLLSVNQDALEDFLQQRIKTTEKHTMTPYPIELRSAIAEDFILQSQLAQLLVNGLRAEMSVFKEAVQPLNDRDAEVKEVAANNHEAFKLIDAIQESLDDAKVEDTLQASYTYYLYKLLLEKKHTALITLYSSAKALPLANDNAARLLALEKAFALNIEINKDPSLHPFILQTKNSLNYARKLQQEGNGNGTVERIYEALKAWYPQAILLQNIRDEEKAIAQMRITCRNCLKKTGDSIDRIRSIYAFSDAIYQHPNIDGNMHALQEDLKKSLEQAEHSSSLLSNNLPCNSQTLMHDARWWLSHADAAYHVEKNPPPQNILTMGITFQEHIISLERPLLESLETFHVTSLKAFLDDQQALLGFVEGFQQALDSVNEGHQEEQIDKEKLYQIMDNFTKGRREAIKARDILERQNPPVSQAIGHQQFCLDYWKKALELLQDPQNNKDSGGNDGSGQNDKENPPPTADNSQANNTPEQVKKPDAMHAVLQQLQEMEGDDSKLSDKPPKEPKKGAKPW